MSQQSESGDKRSSDTQVTPNRSNPYISRGPVRSAEMFFGRQHEMQEIAAFLNGNQSISIVGPRKIGKTSLLFHMMRPEIRDSIGLSEQNLLVYLDCEVLGNSSPEDIFGQFAGEIAAALDSAGLAPEPALDTVAAKPTRLSFEGALRRLNQRGLRIVLILDEFERLSINPDLDLNFFNALRSAAGRYQLMFLTASSRPLIELTYSGRSQEILSSPFFNIFAPLFLGLLSESDAQRLIAEPSERVDQPFSGDLQIYLYKLAGGQPLALQVACFHALDVQDSYQDTGVDWDYVAQIIENRVLRELDSHFQYSWRNLTSTEQDTLRRIGEATKRARTDTTLRAALRDLVQKCLLVASDEGTYHYPSQAWADFVASQEAALTNVSHVASGLLSGTRFSSYEILELLGRGGMAEVYRGRHTRLDRIVAIKVLSSNLANDADFRKRFEREARSIATLKHPNIVSVFDFGDADGMYYMVLEFVAGQTLAQLMHQNGAMPLAHIQPLMHDLAEALDYAHGVGIVHRDIKPSNVMLNAVTADSANVLGLRAVLTDFGIAKLLSGSGGGTKTEGITGTLDYIAPEQIRSSHDLDGRADVYALAVMFYQMLTGQLPFVGDNPAAILMGHLQEPAPDPRLLLPNLPEHVAQAIMCAMTKSPDDRFPTAGAFVRAIQ